MNEANVARVLAVFEASVLNVRMMLDKGDHHFARDSHPGTTGPIHAQRLVNVCHDTSTETWVTRNNLSVARCLAAQCPSERQSDHESRENNAGAICNFGTDPWEFRDKT